MSTTPYQWLEFSETLIGDSEVANRAAASRAYYSVFHRCKALADSLPDPPGEPKWRGTHERMILAMQNCPPRGKKSDTHKKIRMLGIKVSALRVLRTDADYQCKESFDCQQAQIAVATAKTLFEQLDVIENPAGQVSVLERGDNNAA